MANTSSQERMGFSPRSDLRPAGHGGVQTLSLTHPERLTETGCRRKVKLASAWRQGDTVACGGQKPRRWREHHIPRC